MLAVLLLSTDEVTAVHSLASLDQCGNDIRTQTLTIRDNSVRGLTTQVMDEEYPIVDTLQLLEELVYLIE